MSIENQTIQTIMQLAIVARSEGLRGMRKHADLMPDAFGRMGLRLLSSGADPDDIRALLGLSAARDARLKEIVAEGLAGIADAENPQRLETRLQRIANGF